MVGAAAVGAAATTLGVVLAVDGPAWPARGSVVSVTAPLPISGPAHRATVGSGSVVLRRGFTMTAARVGAVAVTRLPPLPRVPTHGVVLGQQTPVAVVAPVQVRIPAQGVQSAIVPVGVDAGTGELAVPADPAQVGWYQFSATPGAAGAAVLAGHVDWKGQPGAFLHLDRVEPGARVEVDLVDGTTHAFLVTQTQLVTKTELPAELFARTGPPRLVLITCGGEFDRSIRRYKQNVVVVATPATS